MEEPAEFNAFETRGGNFKGEDVANNVKCAEQSSQMMSVHRVGFGSEQVIIQLERVGSVE